MRRLQVQFWSCVSITALLGLIVTLFGVGPRPSVNPQPKSDSKTADKTDTKSKTDSGFRSKTDEKTKAKAEPEFIVKTDDEWQRILTVDQFIVTRRKGTEAAFSGKYASGHCHWDLRLRMLQLPRSSARDRSLSPARDGRASGIPSMRKPSACDRQQRGGTAKRSDVPALRGSSWACLR